MAGEKNSACLIDCVSGVAALLDDWTSEDCNGARIDCGVATTLVAAEVLTESIIDVLPEFNCE